MKGAQAVFLYRFMNFMKNNQGNSDLMKWMTRFQIDGRGLAESWMDLLPELDLTTPAIQNEVSLRRQQHNAQQAALQAANDQHVIEHGQMKWNKLSMMRLLGFTSKHITIYFHSQNLIALIFVSTADLSQDQRQSLTSIMTHRKRTMDQYRG